MRKTENIYNTTLEILSNAETNKITANRAALNIAQNKIEIRKKENSK